MQEFIQDDLTFVALPFFFAAIALEAYWSRKNSLGWYRGSDTAASLSMMVFAAVAEFVPRLVAIAIMVKLHEISPLRDVIERQWWAWLLLFFLEDFAQSPSNNLSFARVSNVAEPKNQRLLPRCFWGN